MWELDCEEGWAPKNWCFWTGVLEKTLESPLDRKEIQPVHSEGDQPWDFFGRNDAKSEALVLWPPHAKSWVIGKDFDAGRDWGQEEKGMTKDEMARWHHRLDGCESEWTPGVGDGQEGLAYCNSWCRKESDMTERLNWTDCSVTKSCLTLWPHRLQHANLPCPLLSPRVCSDSCPLSQWCHPTILSSVVPFSSCLQSYPASESIPRSQFFASGGQSIGVSALASVLPMNIQDWFPLGWTGWISLQSKGLSRVVSNTTVQKHQFFSAQLAL